MGSVFEKAVWAVDDNGNILNPLERRIIYVVSPKEIDKDIDNTYNIKWYHFIPFVSLIKSAQVDRLEKNYKDKYETYPLIGAINAEKYFNFPRNHPVRNMLYGMCDIIPDFYVPLSSFHEYFQQLKHSSFLELCASLGAKEIYLEYAEMENMSYKIDASGNIPTELGEFGLDFSLDSSTTKKMAGRLAYKFSEKNKKIKEYQSEWMETEPTWKSMKKMRIENHVESFKAEFNYSDDFGINSEVAAKVAGFGINIGGEFKEIKKTKLKYNVVFWEI